MVVRVRVEGVKCMPEQYKKIVSVRRPGSIQYTRNIVLHTIFQVPHMISPKR